MQFESFQEQVFFATIRITTKTSIGTGFLYLVSMAENKHCMFLVSNRHVYGDPANPIGLEFHCRDKKNPDRLRLGDTITLHDTKFGNIFTGHPDPDVDLACINVSQIGRNDIPVYCTYVDDSILVDFQDRKLLPGNDAWFVGYPENRFDDLNNLPILRRGYIASIPKIDFKGRPEFLIDAQVFQGSSGSPVFTIIDGHSWLVGIVARTMIRNEQVQEISTGTALGVQQTLGLGIVLKSSLLKPLFESAIQKAEDKWATQVSESKLIWTGEGKPISAEDC